LKKVTDGSPQTHLHFFGLGTCPTPKSAYMPVEIEITDMLGFAAFESPRPRASFPTYQDDFACNGDAGR